MDLKGGLGTASYQTDECTVGALAVANPVGSVVIPGTNTFWAWIDEQAGEFGGQLPPVGQPEALIAAAPASPSNTTLVVVATDAILDRDAALRVAIMAQDGLVRAIRPIHTPFDGDTVFVISTGKRQLPDTPETLMNIGAMAAGATARALTRGVYEAESLAGYPSYREKHLTGG